MRNHPSSYRAAGKASYRLDRLVTRSAVRPAPGGKASYRLDRLVTLSAVRREKLKRDRGFRYIVRARLRQHTAEPVISGVRIEYFFFDRLGTEIVPAIGHRGTYLSAGPDPFGGKYDGKSTYRIVNGLPAGKGFYFHAHNYVRYEVLEMDRAKTGKPRRHYGFLLKVWYRGEVQDYHARPAKLANFSLQGFPSQDCERCGAGMNIADRKPGQTITCWKCGKRNLVAGLPGS